MIDHKFCAVIARSTKPLRKPGNLDQSHCFVVFTSSAHAERILVDEFHCDPSQVCVLPDCVNTDTFQPAAAFDAEQLSMLRQQLGIPSDGKVIVYLGLLAEYQGTTLLLEATKRILADHSNVYLLLMGFPGVALYQQKARDLGIEHAVIFTGAVPYAEAPKYLALAMLALRQS